MNSDRIKAVLGRVLTWPPERQQDAADLLLTMEQQNSSVYRLTDEQAQEVRRRLADNDAEKLTLDQFAEGMKRRTGG